MKSTLPNSAIELLATMVSIESVNGNISGKAAPEVPLALEIERIAQAWGLATRRLMVEGEQFNLLVSSVEINAFTKPWLLFESHMDTVTIEGMTIDPTTPKLEAGRMVGRGACDTKASGAAMLWALKEAMEKNELANPTSIAFTVDEECGKAGIRALTSRHFSEIGCRPSLAIVGEPTLLAPVTAHNGAVRWKIVTTGIPAHSSNPANGRSAISDMVQVIQDLENSYIPGLTRQHDLTGKAQCSINQIAGGRQTNMIPDRCEIVIDRRLVPGEFVEDVIPVVEERLQALRAKNSGLRIVQEDVFYDPPMEPLKEDAILSYLRPALESHGLPSCPAGMPYGTDASNLTTAGIPAVVIGPGDIRQAHTVDEWVELAQVEKAVSLFGSFMRQPLTM